MKKILVPVDFSPQTDISLMYALEISRKIKAGIILFHSFFDQIYLSDGGFSAGMETGVLVREEVILEFYQQKQKNLRALRERLIREFNIKDSDIEAKIESGDPEYQILNIIQDRQPELIVMGSSGMGKVSFPSGSVARRVIDSAKVPVLVIPEIKSYKEIKNILYVTELQGKDQGILQNIHGLFSAFDIELHCLSLDIDEKQSDIKSRMESLEINLNQDEYLKDTDCHVISCRHPQEVVETFVQLKDISLIVFIPHKRSTISMLFTSDLTRRDLFQTNIPILAMY